jgi:hypothetical protein
VSRRADPTIVAPLADVAVAVMVVWSSTMPTVASPAELMVATPTSLDAHLTAFVMSRVVGVPLNVPIAMYCDVSPGWLRVCNGGMIDMETRPTETVTVATLETTTPLVPFKLAVMFVVPAATAVSSPALLIVATEGELDDH